MKMFGLFNKFDSKIYSSYEDKLRMMNRWDVEWQKYRSSERFHMRKNYGTFHFDDFTKIIRGIKDMFDMKIGYEGIELYPLVGAGTTWNCKAHTSLAKKEKPITASDFYEFYSTECRLDLPKSQDEDYKPKVLHNGCLTTISKPTMWSNYIWVKSIEKGKTIKLDWSLPMEIGKKITEKYFVKGKGYTLGDGFRR